jgi:acetoin utilization deacetylase AcuC-like enzyme
MNIRTGPLFTGSSGCFRAVACLHLNNLPDALVVSLDVDTYEHDPISHFLLESGDFLKVGAAIGKLDSPVLFVMEGGYAVDKVGHNVVNVLTAS